MQETDGPAAAALWRPLALEPERRYRSRVGPLTVWLKRVDGELYVASALQAGETDVQPLCREEEAGPEPPWIRFVVETDSDLVRLRPVMPDRPVVVRPQYPLKMQGGSRALFFVKVPVWVRLQAGQSDPPPLCELPTVVLSNTWFGTPSDGELCYALKTKARRTLEEAPPDAFQVVCPVSVRNQTSVDLDFRRLCLRVVHLGVYLGSAGLWANTVEVVYRGEEQASQIEITGKLIEAAGDAELVAEPRQPSSRSLLRKSFSFLKSLTGF